MTEPIRLRVWLAIAAPVVVVGGLAAWWLAPHEKPARRASSAASEPEPPPAVPVASAAPASAPVAPPVATALAPRPAAWPPVPSVPATGVGPPPEPVPEVEALWGHPAGSEGWSAEQKAAYRKQRFDDVAARERTLEGEIANAHRVGDIATEQKKTATLSYLRDQRAEVERLMRLRSSEGGAGGS
jgi:hypothetical protein